MALRRQPARAFAAIRNHRAPPLQPQLSLKTVPYIPNHAPLRLDGILARHKQFPELDSSHGPLSKLASARRLVARWSLMPKVTLVRPEYAEKFHCIGPACEDSCCVGWRVEIDEP